MNNITSVKERGNVGTIKDDKIVKLPWTWTKLKKRILKIWHKIHFYFGT